MPKLKRKSKAPAPAAPSWFRDHWQTVLAVLLALLGGGVLIGPHLPDVLPPIVTPVDPAPFVTPDAKPYALILEDTDKILPEPQATWLMEFQLAFRQKGEIRRLHYQSPELLTEPWKSAFDKVSPHATSLPYIAIAHNGTGWEGSQPATRDELMAKAEAFTK